jgi:hypothetical protein
LCHLQVHLCHPLGPHLLFHLGCQLMLSSSLSSFGNRSHLVCHVCCRHFSILAVICLSELSLGFSSTAVI